uniref:DNA replication ATP-dependent helicase/nuclease n=1 Tax=Ascaris suum TaxID=6253 RepID=F1KSN7_ASCSU
MDWCHQKQDVHKRSRRILVDSPLRNDVILSATEDTGGDDWCFSNDGSNGRLAQPLLDTSNISLTNVVANSAQNERMLSQSSGDCEHLVPAKRPKRIEIDAKHRGSDVAGFPSLNDCRKFDLMVTSLENDGYAVKARCKNASLDEEWNVELKDIWADTKIAVGSSIRLIEPKLIAEKDLVVDSESGLVILESDLLVSCTSVMQSLFCARKAVLSDRFRGRNVPNKAMVIGSIVHVLFQAAVRNDSCKVTREWLLDVWHRECDSSMLQQLVAMDMTPAQVENELDLYVDSIVSWVNDYMPPPLGCHASLCSGSRIERIIDIEENIWDHMIGIKGKVDVSFEVKTKHAKRIIKPLELKTGKSKSNFEHDGQVLLYCLALSSRIPNLGTIGDGVLFYVKDGTTRLIQPKSNELKGILHLRNEAAAYLGVLSERSIPEPLSNARNCKCCEYSTVCCALQKTVESSQYVSSSMMELQSLLTSHLTSAHLQYFAKWVRWLFLEWNAAKSVKVDVRDIWKMDNKKREELGRCLTNMSIDFECTGDDCAVVKFKRKSGSPIKSVFTKGDMVIVSTEKNLALAMGPVEATDGNSIDILLSKQSARLKSGGTFVLDKYESFSTYSSNLCNVGLLMENEAHTAKLRSLLIDLNAPTFSKIAKDEVAKISTIVRRLNGEQAHAVVKSLVADDYVLIQGLPGSGKTSTIAVLVRCFLMLGRSVLITSHTHSAVDNLLLKLIQDVDSKDILRLGDGKLVREELRALTLNAKLAESNSVGDEFERAQRILKQTPIVACTCLAVATNTLFSYRRFSICLVDEASLVLESTLIPALLVSEKFVLVGDSSQLSPLVQSRTAREEGMSVSLFDRLKVHSSALITLRYQYRMNRSIARLSSALFYNGELKCANELVASASLEQMNLENIDRLSLPDALYRSVSGDVDDAVVFIDTQSEKNGCFRMEFGTSPGAIFNNGEIKVVAAICDLFIKLRTPLEDIGVISVYRYHADMLRKTINKRIEVNTVDQYQGRDKRIVIVSLVWTKLDGVRRSELLSDARRINVAITRAKHKLILVGCRQSMMSYDTMAALIDLIPECQIKSIIQPSTEETVDDDVRAEVCNIWRGAVVSLVRKWRPKDALRMVT